jgi:hypothetical protein
MKGFKTGKFVIPVLILTLIIDLSPKIWTKIIYNHENRGK